MTETSRDREITLAIFAIAIFAALARLRPVIDPDLPWHLFWAERVLETGARNIPDFNQFTVPGRVFEKLDGPTGPEFLRHLSERRAEIAARVARSP